MANPFLIFAAIFAVSAGVSYVQTKAAIKKAKQASKRNEGLLINSEGTSNYIPIIYGTRRVAGTRVFVATNDVSGGDPNEYLYLVYVLCEGEVDDITDILIDDLPTSDARFAYTNSIAINKFYGTDVQTADATFIAANIGWTSDHTLKGLAYITVRLKWNKDAFSSIPNITALVKGKKVYDPRSATTGYSTNPALCIRDYLTNTRYGKGLDVNVIDDNTFEDAADFYDTTVTFWTSGNTGKLFEFNAVIDTEKNIIDNLKDMLLCCRGFLPYTNGLYELIPDKSASSTFAFTTNNIIGGIAIKGESKQDKYNRVICNFIDPNNNWQENTAIWPDAGSAEEIAYLAEDGGTELVGDFDLPCITNYYAARDLARVFLARSRNAIRASLRATSDALNVTVGDVVTVTHPTPGWSAKPFQVEEVTINYDGTCTVSLLEYDSSIYTYDPASEQLSYADTDLPNPFFVSPPSNLVITESSIVSKDGTVVREIYLDWSASTDAFVESYELQFKLSAATEYFSVFTFEPRYLAVYGDVGEVYNYRIRAINSLGVSSDFLTGTYTTVGDITAPATPTGLAVDMSYNQAVISWDYPTERDYKETIIYASLTNNSATAVEEARASGSSFIYYGILSSTTYYVWIKHEDFSGNISGFSSVAVATTTSGLPTAALADNSVTTPKINGLAVTEAKIATDAVTTSKINAGAVTNAKLDANAVAANVFAAGVQPIGIAATVPLTKTVDTIFVIADAKLYRWNGTAYVKTVDDGDITGMTVSKLTAGTINAAITTTNILQLSTNGKIYTAGKTSAASTTAGVFLGDDGGVYKLGVGNATNSIIWDGSALTIKGNLTGSSGTFAGNLESAGYVKASGGLFDIDITAAVNGSPSTGSFSGVVGRTATAFGVIGKASSSGTGVSGSSVTGVGVSGVSPGFGNPANSNCFGGLFSGTTGLKAFADATTGEGITVTQGNLLLGSPTNTGISNLIIKEGTPGSRLDNQMILYGALSSDADTTFGIITEQGVVAGTGAFTGILQIRIVWNGAEYWLPLQAV